MKCVKTIEQLTDNLRTLDKYLSNATNTASYKYASERIRLGKCFVVENNGRYKFYPSRFIGYYKNSMCEHDNNKSKDGGVTNSAITKILSDPLTRDSCADKWSMYETEYIKYCESLEIKPANNMRSYWLLKS